MKNKVRDTGHVDGLEGVFRDVFSEFRMDHKNMRLQNNCIYIQAFGNIVVLTDNGHWFFQDTSGG